MSAVEQSAPSFVEQCATQQNTCICCIHLRGTWHILCHDLPSQTANNEPIWEVITCTSAASCLLITKHNLQFRYSNPITQLCKHICYGGIHLLRNWVEKFLRIVIWRTDDTIAILCFCYANKDYYHGSTLLYKLL